MNKFNWINIFVRDILLSIVIVWINYTLNFNSWFAALAAGMQIVMVTWHLDSLIKLNKKLDNGFSGYDDNPAGSSRNIYPSLQQD